MTATAYLSSALLESFAETYSGEATVPVTVAHHPHTFILRLWVETVQERFRWHGQMRGQIEIITEILKLCLLPRSQTAIRGKTCLNHLQIKTYLSLLETRGLLEHNSGKYTTTLRGGSFLEAAAQLSLALEDYTHDISREATLRLDRKDRSNNGEVTTFSATVK